jgi:hypothetical protein
MHPPTKAWGMSDDKTDEPQTIGIPTTQVDVTGGLDEGEDEEDA